MQQEGSSGRHGVKGTADSSTGESEVGRRGMQYAVKWQAQRGGQW